MVHDDIKGYDIHEVIYYAIKKVKEDQAGRRKEKSGNDKSVKEIVEEEIEEE